MTENDELTLNTSILNMVLEDETVKNLYNGDSDGEAIELYKESPFFYLSLNHKIYAIEKLIPIFSKMDKFLQWENRLNDELDEDFEIIWEV